MTTAGVAVLTDTILSVSNKKAVNINVNRISAESKAIPAGPNQPNTKSSFKAQATIKRQFTRVTTNTLKPAPMALTTSKSVQ